jgi:hypothetical protein
MRYAPSGQGWPSCLLSGRLPQLLASLPIVQNFLRFIFIQLIYPESASGHAPAVGEPPQTPPGHWPGQRAYTFSDLKI